MSEKYESVYECDLPYTVEGNDIGKRSTFQMCATCVSLPRKKRRCRRFRTAILLLAFWNVMRLSFLMITSQVQENHIRSIEDIKGGDTCHVPGTTLYDIPRVIDLALVALDSVEKEIFQGAYDLIKTNTIRANGYFVENHIDDNTNHIGDKLNQRILARELLNHVAEATTVNDYIYFPGGHWRPASCQPRWKVAIVIPYRDRPYNLPVLLRNLVPFLFRQQLEFGIFIAQQGPQGRMNRGMIKNIGFVEASKFFDWDCVIFHDIDHVPVNDSNYYGCQDFPRHFAVYDEDTNYRLLYRDIFGGVVGLTMDQMIRINGYPNVYWGWGGEDDELRLRVVSHGLAISRPRKEGFYRALYHEKHQRRDECRERFCYLYTFQNRHSTDGLTNLRYPKPTVTLDMLYTKIMVDIEPLEWQPSWGTVCQYISREEVFFYLSALRKLWTTLVW